MSNKKYCLLMFESNKQNKNDYSEYDPKNI